MRRHYLAATAAIFLFGCHFDSMTESLSAGDSSSSGADNEDDGYATATITVTSADDDDGADTSTGSSDSSSDGDSGSESDDGSSSDESSTGEPLPPDWALQFDGSSRGVKVGNAGEYEWTAPDFTVEAWVQIVDTDATGIIFASENLTSTAGWAFYLHPDWHTFVFSYLDGTQINRLTMGPTVTEIGEGWHHLAATKDGDTVFLHVDGVAMVADNQSNGAISSAGGTVWTIGGTATADPTAFWRLDHAVIDDVRITESPLYDGNFDPPPVFDCDPCALVLSLDEGEGVIASDATSDIDFMIEDPQWVEGYAP